MQGWKGPGPEQATPWLGLQVARDVPGRARPKQAPAWLLLSLGGVPRALGSPRQPQGTHQKCHVWFRLPNEKHEMRLLPRLAAFQKCSLALLYLICNAIRGARGHRPLILAAPTSLGVFHLPSVFGQHRHC